MLADDHAIKDLFHFHLEQTGLDNILQMILAEIIIEIFLQISYYIVSEDYKIILVLGLVCEAQISLHADLKSKIG